MFDGIKNNTNISDIFFSSNDSITWEKILVAVVLYVITFATVFGNVLVLIAVKINKKLQTTFNYYIVNLAITDVAVAVTAMSFMATHTVLGYWPFGEALCALWIFFDYGMTFVSVFTLNMISVDRFWSVKWSVHYRQHHTKRKCIISIIFVWLFMLVLWVPPWLTDRLTNSKPGECFWDPSLNKEVVFIVAILGHHAPFCIMILSYTHVFLFMRKRSKIVDVIHPHTQTSGICEKRGNGKSTTNDLSTVPVPNLIKVKPVKISSPPPQSFYNSAQGTNDGPTVSYIRVQNSTECYNETQSGRETRFTRDKKVFVTLSYIVIGYAILWLPFHIIFDIGIAHPGLVPEEVINTAFWMTYFNSTINPILYNFSSSEFKKTFRNILKLRKC